MGRDESDASLAAFRLALSWKEALGAEVLGLHLVSGEGGCCYPTYLDPKGLSLAEVLEKAEAFLRARYTPLDRLLVTKGEDEADLVELARREKLDLLVLGSKAKRTWRRRLGGTVEAALQRTDLPLLVVPEATVW